MCLDLRADIMVASAACAALDSLGSIMTTMPGWGAHDSRLTLCLDLRADTMVASAACASFDSLGGVMMTTPLERPRISVSSCTHQQASWQL